VPCKADLLTAYAAKLGVGTRSAFVDPMRLIRAPFLIGYTVVSDRRHGRQWLFAASVKANVRQNIKSFGEVGRDFAVTYEPFFGQ
jgi:hypothetical protein